MAVLSVTIGRLKLKNPVIAASGTFGFGVEMSRACDIAGLGAIVLKSLTVRPRSGNPPPRIAETPAGMINSIGLENPGIEKFMSGVLPLVARLPVPCIGSIAGERIEEYAELARTLENSPLHALEINVSCPNVEAGGMSFGCDPEAASRVVRAVRKESSKTLILKLTPAAPDLPAVAAAAEKAGADALTVANTFPGLAVDWRNRRPSIRGIRGRGGLSGPAIKPLALRLVREAFKNTNIPVIASGGVVSPDDAMEFVTAGATAVQVGTATFVDPAAACAMAAGIARLLDSTGIPDLNSWIGTLDDSR